MTNFTRGAEGGEGRGGHLKRSAADADDIHQATCERARWPKPRLAWLAMPPLWAVGSSGRKSRLGQTILRGGGTPLTSNHCELICDGDEEIKPPLNLATVSMATAQSGCGSWGEATVVATCRKWSKWSKAGSKTETTIFYGSKIYFQPVVISKKILL